MRYMRFFLTLSLLLIILSSCKQKEDVSGMFSVSGKILIAESPVEGAVVSIDKSFNWETTTDINGNFTITGVSPGVHTLSVKYVDNNSLNSTNSNNPRYVPNSNNPRYVPNSNNPSYVQIDKDISVSEDLVLNNLKLPKPVKVYPLIDCTESSMKIIWSPTDASDFREYKIYRHNTSGLDETTGELVHVSTEITDTVFIDTKLSSLSTYYYRVYIMNEYGKLGGSNIVFSKTSAKNYIINGDFEEGDDIYAFWSYSEGNGYYGNFGVISFSDSVKKSGNRSLMLYADKEIDTFGLLLTRAQILVGKKSGLDKDKNYKLSYWIKTSGQISKDRYWNFNGYNDLVAGIEGDICLPGPSGIKTTDTDWTFIEQVIPASSCGIEGIYIKSFCTYTWIDDLRLEDIAE